MPLKVTEHAIDLSGLDDRDYHDEDVKGFRRVRTEYARLFQPILHALSAEPSRLPLPGVDYNALAALLQRILELEDAEAWLAKKQEMVSETRRALLHKRKPDADTIVEVARTLAHANDPLDSLFAELFDYLAEPGQKSAATQRKQKPPNPPHSDLSLFNKRPLLKRGGHPSQRGGHLLKRKGGIFKTEGHLLKTGGGALKRSRGLLKRGGHLLKTRGGVLKTRGHLLKTRGHLLKTNEPLLKSQHARFLRKGRAFVPAKA